MGWNGGTELMEPLIRALLREVPDGAARSRIYQSILSSFFDRDWDTEDEVMGMDVEFDISIYPVEARPGKRSGLTAEDIENFYDEFSFTMFSMRKERRFAG